MGQKLRKSELNGSSVEELELRQAFRLGLLMPLSTLKLTSKRGKMGPGGDICSKIAQNGTKCDQTRPNGPKWGQTGLTGANRAKWNQTGLIFCMHNLVSNS